MQFIKVEITEFIDEHQPGFVECRLTDAEGFCHRFLEKVSVVSENNLWVDSNYPQPGTMACDIKAEWTDESGRNLVRVTTEKPWSIESCEGKTEFVVFDRQILRWRIDEGANLPQTRRCSKLSAGKQRSIIFSD